MSLECASRKAAHSSLRRDSHTTSQAAIARLLHIYDHSKMGNLRDLVEPGKILKIVGENDDVAEFAAKIQRNKTPMAKCSAFGFVCAVAARTAPKSRIFEFIDIVSGGLAHSEEDAVRCLHVKFRDLSFQRTNLHQEDIAALTIKAWNAWVNNEETVLKVSNSERTNAGFPRVVDWGTSKQRSA